MPAQKKEKREQSFEEALKELEAIVTHIESGDVPLDDMLELYEKGVALSKFCREKLDASREKLKIITDGMNPDEI